MINTQLSSIERVHVGHALEYVNRKGRAAANRGDLACAAAMTLVKQQIENLNDGMDVPYDVVQSIIALGEYSSAAE